MARALVSRNQCRSAPISHAVEEAVERFATESRTKERGAIYTKREVVDFILDLVGYTDDQPLADFRVLEPSIGRGDFILPVLDRLLQSAARERHGLNFDRLASAIRGVELHRDTYTYIYTAMYESMALWGISDRDISALLDLWFVQGDFLLCHFDQDFTHVIGNPPYVRQDVIPDVLIGEYRLRYDTIYDRADIYVPFIEQSLRWLQKGGKLGFVCADRWTKNRYGKKLREMISSEYALSIYVDMAGIDAFHSKVDAYPAITIIERKKPKKKSVVTRICVRPELDGPTLKQLAKDLTADVVEPSGRIHEVKNVSKGSNPWILDDPEAMALARRLETSFPSLEDAGCKVGIGVATGADKAFIGHFDDMDVEDCRKLPLVMTKDIKDGSIVWQGRGVINPFDDQGNLVSLSEFPRLSRYLEERRNQLIGRHVASRSPQNWYRTIDKIDPELTVQEKLLIPDIKGDASITYEAGRFYPHHNLYYITSNEWDLQALRAVMQCGIARFFVSLYSIRMRGGYLRFQAQYLRRIRIPNWASMNKFTRHQLQRIGQGDDGIRDIVATIYGLSSSERVVLERGSAG